MEASAIRPTNGAIQGETLPNDRFADGIRMVCCTLNRAVFMAKIALERAEPGSDSEFTRARIPFEWTVGMTQVDVRQTLTSRPCFERRHRLHARRQQREFLAFGLDAMALLAIGSASVLSVVRPLLNCVSLRHDKTSARRARLSSAQRCGCHANHGDPLDQSRSPACRQYGILMTVHPAPCCRS